MNPTIAVLIPTRGDRPAFLSLAYEYLKRQTLLPDIIELVCDPPISEGKDLCWRVQMGLERIARQTEEIDNTVVLFWEDDDWYAPNYIESMVKQYKKAGSPELFGIEYSIYYHLLRKSFRRFKHTGRASLMSTMMKLSLVEKIHWTRTHEPWMDLYLWEGMSNVDRKLWAPEPPISVGIKHGIGVCGGIGHSLTAKKFRYDGALENLRSWIGDDVERYEDWFELRNDETEDAGPEGNGQEGEG